MADQYENTPFEALPEERQELIKNFINGTIDTVTVMQHEHRVSMINIANQTLESELRELDFEEFNCSSYDEFMYQIAVAAAYADNDFSEADKESVDEIVKTLGLNEQLYDSARNAEINLSEVSKKLKSVSRGMFFTLVSLVVLNDKQYSDDEYNLMLHILAP